MLDKKQKELEQITNHDEFITKFNELDMMWKQFLYEKSVRYGLFEYQRNKYRREQPPLSKVEREKMIFEKKNN